MKKSLISLFLAALMIVVCAVPAIAAEADYTFTVTVDDSSVVTGDTVKVSLEITKNDGSNLAIYTMQDYVGFDTEYFRVVDGSLNVTAGFAATVQDGCVYVNRFSDRALEVESDTITVMTFEVEAINPGEAEFDHSVVEMVSDKLEFYSVDRETAAVTVEEDEDYEPVVPDITNKRYDIDVPSRISHGDIALSHKTAKKGTTVRIIIDPDTGYELEELAVVRSNGRTVSLTKRSDDTYSFVMPGEDVEIVVSFAKIKDADTPDTPDVPDTPVHECPSEPYTDVDQTQWYHEAIDYVIENGLMNGMSADTFAPNVTTSRAMIATILWRQQGQPTVDYVMPFTDVPMGQWYSEAIRWAAANGIVNGYGNGLFGPDDTITREQFAAMLYRYESVYGTGLEEGWSYELDFTDADAVADWAYEAMCWCNMNGIINGMGGGILLPQGNATRAQAAQMLMNYNNME